MNLIDTHTHPAPCPPPEAPVSPAYVENHQAANTIADQLHALEVTAVRLAEERDQALADADRERIRADGLYAANLRLTADAIIREEALQAELATAREERDQAERAKDIARGQARVSGEMTAAMSRKLYKLRVERSGLVDEITRLVTDLGQANREVADSQRQLADARKQLADARRPRILRRPRPTT